MNNLSRLFWQQVWLTIVVALVLLALYSSLGRQLMPLVENYHDNLEELLQDSLKQPVSIGSLTGSWTGLSPVIILQDIAIGGPQGIHFELAEAEIDVAASLFYRQPIFNKFHLKGGEAQLQQLSSTQWQVTPDWIITTTDKDDNANESKEQLAWPTWLSRQENIQLSFLSLQLSRLGHEVERYNVERVRWRSLGDQHQLLADISLAQEVLSNIRVQASLQGELWPLQAHNGHLYVEIEQQDWAKWFSAKDDQVLQVNQFVASAKGWLQIKGGNLHAVYFQADVPTLDVQRNQQQLKLTQGKVTLAGEHSDQDWHLQIHPHFAESLPLDRLSLSQISAQGQTAWQLGIPELDIGAAQQLLERYQVLPEKVAEFINGTAPTGVAKNIRISAMQDKQDQKIKFDVRADVQNVDSVAYHGIPALHGVNAALQLQKNAGMVEFDNAALDLHLANLYAQPWHLSELNGRFHWRIFADHAQLLLDNTSAHLHELDTPASWPVTAQMNILLPMHHSAVEPSLGLLLGVAEGPASLQQQLVPNLVGAETQSWLNQGIGAGQVKNAVYALQTSLVAGHGAESFSSLLYLDIADVSLRYLEGWPEVENIFASLYLDEADLDIQLSSATTLGGRLRPGVGYAKLRSRPQGPLLEVSAGLRGDAAEAIEYFTSTPLQQTLNHAFDHWQAAGQHNSDIYLRIAFGENAVDPEVWVTSYLDNNRLSMTDLGLNVEKIAGKIAYSSKAGISSEQLKASLLGGNFSGKLTSIVGENGQLKINLEGAGQASWDAIQSWQPLFVFQPISGRLAYQAQLDVADGHTQIRLNSDLLGTAIDLPKPYGKEQDQASSLNVLLQASDSLLLDGRYQDDLNVKLLLVNSELERGQVVLGGKNAKLSTEKGLTITGEVDRLIHLDEWWESWTKLDFSAAAGNSTDNQADLFRVNLNLHEVDAWGTSLGATQVKAHGGESWEVLVTSPVVTGQAWLQLDDSPIKLTLDYIHLDKTEADDEQAAVVEDPWQDIRPQDLPALDLVVENVRVGSQEYGSWKANSRPQPDGLEVEILDSNIFGTKVTGYLHWHYQDGRHHTVLDKIHIQGENIENLQRGFALPEFIEGQKLTADVNFNWPSSPLGMRFLDTDGFIKLDIRKGRLATESGSALKALGALNINSLSRRLKLDFSDLYKSGLAFDKLTASMELDNQTITFQEPMRIEGLGGKFITTGSIYLPAHELDMRVAVVLPISNNLPLVAILAGLSPPVAASIYITEKLVGDELSRFTTANYEVTGDWQDPQINLRGAFNQDGSKKRSIKQRILGIFGWGD